MDVEEFLMQIDVSAHANIDELANHFARVLSWMRIDPYSEPNTSKVRLLLKAALFLYGNLEIHGQTLEKKLKDCRSIPKNELNSLLAKFHAGTLLSDVCEKVLMTITGPNHLLEIQSFCHDFLDATQYSRILSAVQKSRQSYPIDDQGHEEMPFLITTIFELQPADEIEQTIEQLIDNVDFEKLASIINQQESHTYFAMKCKIVQMMLCSRLERGLVSRNFINSMFEVCTISEDGLRTYFKSLKNSMFASSLMTFFIKYLTFNAASTNCPEETKFIKYDHLHMNFLIAGIMSKKSECRLEFHKKLAAISVNVSANVLLSISQLNFVYNF